MRKRTLIPLLSLVVLAAVLAVAPQLPPVRGWLFGRVEAVLAARGIDLDVARVAGNPYRRLRLERVELTMPGLEADAAALELRYFLPSLIVGELPLSVEIDDLAAEVDVDGFDLGGGSAPPVRVRLDDLAVRGADVQVDDVPYTLPDLSLDEVALRGGGEGIEFGARLTTPDGSARVTGSAELSPPSARVTVERADLAIARHWWEGITGGVASGEVRIGPAGTEADLRLANGSLEFLGLAATDLEGPVRYRHPEIDADLAGRALGGPVAVDASVDLAARRWAGTVDGTAGFAEAGAWLLRAAPFDPAPYLGGEAEVRLAAEGWTEVDLRGSARGDGTLFGYPLEALEASFGFDERGVVADATGRLAGGDLAVDFAPAAPGSRLRIEAQGLELAAGTRGAVEGALRFTPDGLRADLTASAETTAAGPLGREAQATADVALTPGDGLELFVEGGDARGAELSGAGVFQEGVLAGQLNVRGLALAPLSAPLSATLRADGPLGDLPLTLEVGGPQPVGVALDAAGGVRVDTDLRGRASATLRGGALHDVDAAFGPLSASGAFDPAAPWRLTGEVAPVTARLAANGDGALQLPLAVPDFAVGTAVAPPALSAGAAPNGAENGSDPLRARARVDLGPIDAPGVRLEARELLAIWSAAPGEGWRVAETGSAAGETPLEIVGGRGAGVALDLRDLRAEILGRAATLRGRAELGGDTPTLELDLGGDGLAASVSATEGGYRAELSAAAGSAAGPVTLAAPLDASATLDAGALDLRAALGELQLEGSGTIGADGGGPAIDLTLRGPGRDEALELGWTPQRAEARGALELAPVARALGLPAIDGRLDLDLAAPPDALAEELGAGLAGEARLALDAPAAFDARLEADGERTTLELLGRELPVEARGTVLPSPALTVRIGPLEGIALDGAQISGSGTLPAYEVARLGVPSQPWRLEGDLASGAARLDVGDSTAELTWGDGWRADARLAQPVEFGPRGARLEGELAIGSETPRGRADLRLVGSGEAPIGSDPARPALTASGAFDALELRGAFDAAALAAAVAPLPGVAPTGAVTFRGDADLFARSGSAEGDWAAAPFRAAVDPQGVAANLDLPGPGGAPPLQIRAATGAEPLRIVATAAGAPLTAVTSRVEGLPAGLTGEVAAAIGLDGELALELAEGERRWSGTLRLAPRAASDLDALPADVRGAIVLEGRGAALGVTADLAVTPELDDTAGAAGTPDAPVVPVVLRADGELLPAPDLALRAEYGEVELEGRVAPAPEGGLPRLDATLRVPAVEGVVRTAPLALRLSSEGDALRVATTGAQTGARTEANEGAATDTPPAAPPGATVDLRLAPGELAGRAVVPLTVAGRDLAVALDLAGAPADPRVDVAVSGAVRGAATFAGGAIEGAVTLDPSAVPGGGALSAPPRATFRAATDGSWAAELRADAAALGRDLAAELAVTGRGVTYRGSGALRADGATLLPVELGGSGAEATLRSDLAALDPAALSALTRGAAQLGASGVAELATAPLRATLDAALSGEVAGLPVEIVATGDLGGVRLDAAVAGTTVALRPRQGGGVALSVGGPEIEAAGSVQLSPAPAARLRGVYRGRTLRIDVDPAGPGDPAGALRLEASVGDVAATAAWLPAPERGGVPRVTLEVAAGADVSPVPFALDAALAFEGAGAPQLGLDLAVGGDGTPLAAAVRLAGTVGGQLDLSGDLRTPRLPAPAALRVSGAPGSPTVALELPGDEGGALRIETALAGVRPERVALGGAATLAGVRVVAEPGLTWRAASGDGADDGANDGGVDGSPAGFTGALALEAPLPGGLRARLEAAGDGSPASLAAEAADGLFSAAEPGTLRVAGRVVAGGENTAQSGAARLALLVPASPLAADAPLRGALRIDATGTPLPGGTDPVRARAEVAIEGSLRAPRARGDLRLSGPLVAEGEVAYRPGRGELRLTGDRVGLDARLAGREWSAEVELDEVPIGAARDLLPAAAASAPLVASGRVTVRAEAEGTLGGAARAVADPVRIDGPSSRIEGRISLADALLASLRFDVAASDLAPSLGGRLTGPLVVRAEPADLPAARVDAALELASLTIPGLDPTLEATARVGGSVRAPALDLALAVADAGGGSAAGELRLSLDDGGTRGDVRSDLALAGATTDLQLRWRDGAFTGGGTVAYRDVGFGVAPTEPGAAGAGSPPAALALEGFGRADGWHGRVVPTRGDLELRGPLASLDPRLAGAATLNVGPLLGPEAAPLPFADPPPGDAAERPWLTARADDASAFGVDLGELRLVAASGEPVALRGERIVAELDLGASPRWRVDLDGQPLPGDLVVSGTVEGLGARAEARLDLRGDGAVPLDLDVAGTVMPARASAAPRAAFTATGRVAGGDARLEGELGAEGWDGELRLTGARLGGERIVARGTLGGPPSAPELALDTEVDGPLAASGTLRASPGGVRLEQQLELPAVDAPVGLAGSLWPEVDLTLTTATGGALRARAASLSAELVVSGAVALRGGPLTVRLAGVGGALQASAVVRPLDAGVTLELPRGSLGELAAALRDPPPLRGTERVTGEIGFEVDPTPALVLRDLRYDAPGDRARLELGGRIALQGAGRASGTLRLAPVPSLPSLTEARTLALEIGRNDAGAWRLALGDDHADVELVYTAGGAIDLFAASDLAGAELRADLTVAPERGAVGSVTIDRLVVPAAGGRIAVEGAFDSTGARAEGRLAVTLLAPEETIDDTAGDTVSDTAGDTAGDPTVEAPVPPAGGPVPPAGGSATLSGGYAFGRWLPPRYRPPGSAEGENDGALSLRLRELRPTALPGLERRAPNLELGLSGTLDLRGSTLVGSLVAPGARIAGTPLPLAVEVTGDPFGRDAEVRIQGTIEDTSFGVTATRDAAEGVFRLEQFPAQVIAEAVAGDTAIQASVTGVLRWRLPYDAPADGELRLATQRVILERGDDTTRGAITLDYVDGVLTLRDVGFGGEGRDGESGEPGAESDGSWAASGVVGPDRLELSLTATEADFTPLLQLVPALARFGTTAEGSFELDASGSLSDPDATFRSDRLSVGVAGGRYALESARVTLEGGMLDGSGVLLAESPVEGRLDVTAEADLSLLPLRASGATLRFVGDGAVPVLGAVRGIEGTIVAAPQGPPRLDASADLGAPVTLRGTLAPLDLRLEGDDVRARAPRFFLDQSVADVDLRVVGRSGAVGIGGRVGIDSAEFALGIRPPTREAEPSAEPIRGARAVRERIAFDGLRVVAPRSLTLSENFGTLEGRADLTLTGTAAAPELAGTAEALRGSVRFSGRDFTLQSATATFDPARGVFPRLDLVAVSAFEKNRVVANGGEVRFLEPRAGGRFDVVLQVDGEVEATPDGERPFAVEVDPELSSPAVIEIEGGAVASSPRSLGSGELLRLVTLGRVDLAADLAEQSDLATSVAQTALDTAVDLLVLSELQQVLGDALGVDVFEIRTTSLSNLLAGGLDDPFSVSLRVGGYLSEEVFASFRIGNVDEQGEASGLSNEVSITYDLGPLEVDLAGRVNFASAQAAAPTPGLSATVGYAVTPLASIETGIDLSSERSLVSFGVTLRW